MTNTQTAPDPKPDPNNPDKTMTHRCRSLRVNGAQCRQAALRGQDFCVQHARRGPITFDKYSALAIPLLEDTSAIQLLCTKITHGILAGEIPPERANPALRACKIAAFTLPRPARLKADEPSAAEESVTTIETDQFGDLIGPREAYLGPTGKFAPQWSMAKYMYEQACEQAGKPKPTCAADFPPEGWLTEQELEEQQTDEGARLMMKRYEKKLEEITRRRAEIEAKETEEALAAGLPDPHAKPKSSNPDCPFGIHWCDGVRKEHACCYCKGQREMEPSDPRYPGDKAVASVATLREYFQEKKEKAEAAEEPHSFQAAEDPQDAAHQRNTPEATCYPPQATGDRPEPTGHRPEVTGHRPQPTDWSTSAPQSGATEKAPAFRPGNQRPQKEGASAPDASQPHRMPVPETTPYPTSHTPEATGYRPQPTGHRPQLTGSPTSAPQSGATEKAPAFRPGNQRPQREGASAPDRAAYDLPDPCFEFEPDTDENGECWCGGPNQMFPCHQCRAKKESGGLDLKAVADAANDPLPATRYPENVVKSVNRAKYQISRAQKSVSRKINAKCSPAPCTLHPRFYAWATRVSAQPPLRTSASMAAGSMGLAK